MKGSFGWFSLKIKEEEGAVVFFASSKMSGEVYLIWLLSLLQTVSIWGFVFFLRLKICNSLFILHDI